MALKRRVILLGATGSIGASTLRVLRRHADRLELVGVASRQRGPELAAIAREFQVPRAALHDPSAAAQARREGIFPPGTELLEGPDGLCQLAAGGEADLVVSAIVGTAGLRPTLAAIEAGRSIALASKEILVLAGAFVVAAARRRGVRLLPLDSEHNALFQCLEGRPSAHVRRLLLTASGGPFRDWTRERMAAITPAQAHRHPTWSMGPKVTIDSATLANKGLEMIEAHWLFDVLPPVLQVVIHPQSVVHSMVELVDGSVLAQLSPPDMTFAIQHCLLYPDRAPGVCPPLDFTRSLHLDFSAPDESRFPCLRLAREALLAGGAAPAVFNAANEVAVAAFLENRLPFLAIPSLVEETLAAVGTTAPAATLEEVLEADAEARRQAGARLPFPPR